MESTPAEAAGTIIVHEVQVKSILNRHKKRDDWFLDDYSLNPYQGCPFNCLYCYIRGSKYGENLSRAFAAKSNAPELLERQLGRRASKEEYGIIVVASATEPYPPLENKLKLTRRLLEIILKFRFPVEIITKSKLVIRDLDLLREIDKTAILPPELKLIPGRGAIVSFSISTLDEKLAGIFEPGAPPPVERLETMKACREAGFLVGVNFIPVLPFLSDSDEDLERGVKAAHDYGAHYVFFGGLTLFGSGPADCKTQYHKALQTHFPELVAKYRSLFRIFFSPPGEYQKRLEEKARDLCRKYGLKYGLA